MIRGGQLGKYFQTVMYVAIAMIFSIVFGYCFLQLADALCKPTISGKKGRRWNEKAMKEYKVIPMLDIDIHRNKELLPEEGLASCSKMLSERDN